MRMTNDFFIPPFNSTTIKDKYLVSNMLGSWSFLDPQEFRLLHGMRVVPGTPLFDKLKYRELVVDASNLERVLQGYRNLNRNLFLDAGLHIAVITTRCNLRCSYCQARAEDPRDMTIEAAEGVLKSMFSVRRKGITLEFQGGEPLANWSVLKFMVECAKEMNAVHKKDLEITIVSNLLLLDDEKMVFLKEHGVGLCASFDGLREAHDANRVTPQREGTYDRVVEKINWVRQKYQLRVGLLPTITKEVIKHPRELVDSYVVMKQTSIALRQVNNMGGACSRWVDVGYSPEEFRAFYVKAMDYILELNKKGVNISERMASVFLKKILFKQDPGYVDLMNPCGAGRAVITYMPDGSCYPCDEARMLGEDMFRLGNVLTDGYEDMVKKESLMHLLQAASSELWNYGSVFSPWIGVCPVVNYALQKNLVPKVKCSPVDKVLEFQLKYLFEKMLEDVESTEIFVRWAGGKKNVEKTKQEA